MDEQLTGQRPGEAAVPDESRLAARLIREEFGEPAAVLETTAPVPLVAPAAAAGGTAVAAGAAIHEEFAEPVPPPRSRSHRTGMLAGLGVVGALLAVLVLLSPGSGQPRLPVQSVHDVSPISASGPQTAAATAAPAAAPASTSSTSTPSTTTTQPHLSVTVPTTVTYVYLPGTTQTQAQTPTPTTSAPAPAPTTAPPPPPPTTTTTSPPTTTPTTTQQCILDHLIC
jgi:hypothetical protein